MNIEIWQQLLSLETREITTQWFAKIHSRKLSARRAKEINSSAKQAREYFRNANNSDYSVRPLLTYYGITSLSRSLILLLKAQGGDEGLNPGPGLETVNWGQTLSGDISKGLSNINNLKIRMSTGLFSDFITYTKNRISIHVNSSGVDWSICYNVPKLGDELSLGELFSRLPDLNKEYSNIFEEPLYISVDEMTYNDKDGFNVKVRNKLPLKFKNIYESYGYSVISGSNWSTLSCDADTFQNNIPLFIHSYIHKMFGSIPKLYLSVPFNRGNCYSQLGITFILSYVLGMLVRYYPTHWISLLQGEKGDTFWPIINRAQQFVENIFPELVMELIIDILKDSNSSNETKNA